MYNKPITHNDVMLLEIDVMVFQDILKGFVLLQHQVFCYDLQESNRCSMLDPEDSPAVVVLGTSLTGISNAKHFMHETHNATANTKFYGIDKTFTMNNQSCRSH